MASLMSNGERQGGFTYLTALVLVAASGLGLAAAAEFWSHARQRDKEAELLWIGEQFKHAIGLYYHRSPGRLKRYPEKLEDLLEDRRHLDTVRHLRRIYTDPMTGKPDWGLVHAPGGGIMGVHSLSAGTPIRQVQAARSYTEWRFTYLPPVTPQRLVRPTH